MNTRRTFSPATAAWLLIGVAVILCAAGLVFRHVHQSNARHQQFLEIKTKAEQGDVQAQSDLGDQFFYGEGTAKDRVEAVKWWRQAAEQGDGKSQFSLAFSYGKGLGVEKDTAQGLKWYQSTMEQGFDIREVARKLGSVVE